MEDSGEKHLLKAEAQQLVQYRFNCIRGFISDGVPLAQLAKEHDVSVRHYGDGFRTIAMADSSL